MMRRLSSENPIGRLFKNQPRVEFRITLHGTPEDEVSDAGLEEAAEQVLDLLIDEAAGTALGPAIACDFKSSCLEVVFTIEATSAEDLHRKMGQVMHMLEDADFEVEDSRASRVHPDREPVLAY